MAAHTWYPTIRSTPLTRRYLRTARRFATVLIGLALLYTAVMGLAIAMAAGTDAKLHSQLLKSLGGEAGNKAFVSGMLFIGLACGIMMWLNKSRLGSAEKIAVQREVEIERDAFELIFRRRLAEEHAKLDAWKSEQISAIYQTVLDQQARGLLTCPNCGHGEHRKSA